MPSSTFTGNYTLYTSNPTDGNVSLDNAFFVNGNFTPSIVAVNPTGGQPGETLNVTILGRGTQFNQASHTTSVYFGSTQGAVNPIVNSKNAVNDTVITANISIPLNANVGAYNTIVYNGNLGAISGDFFVYDNCLSYYATSYDSIQNNFTLTLDSITSDLSTAFYWDFGDGNTSTSVTPSHTFALDTTYNVCLTVVNSIGDSCTYCHLIGMDLTGVVLKKSGFSLNVVHHDGSITVDVPKLEEDGLESVIIYPNPFDSYIQINTKQTAVLEWVLFDISSRKISQTNFVNSIKFKTESLAKGIYIYQIKSSEGVLKTGKIVKE